jgi:hypothetical protein
MGSGPWVAGAIVGAAVGVAVAQDARIRESTSPSGSKVRYEVIRVSSLGFTLSAYTAAVKSPSRQG